MPVTRAKKRKAAHERVFPLRVYEFLSWIELLAVSRVSLALHVHVRVPNPVQLLRTRLGSKHFASLARFLRRTRSVMSGSALLHLLTADSHWQANDWDILHLLPDPHQLAPMDRICPPTNKFLLAAPDSQRWSRHCEQLATRLGAVPDKTIEKIHHLDYLEWRPLNSYLLRQTGRRAELHQTGSRADSHNSMFFLLVETNKVAVAGLKLDLIAFRWVFRPSKAKPAPLPSTVIVEQHFDFTVVQNWFDGRTFHVGHPEDIMARRIVSPNPDPKPERLKKYRERGFTFTPE